MTKDKAGHTAQSGRIIELSNTTPPSFFSEKIGRDFGSPMGGWTADRAKATILTQDKAEALLAGPLATQAPNARVVPA